MAWLLVGQFGVYALAWAVLATQVREVRPALLWWCGYALLQALGLWQHADAATVGAGGGIPMPAAVLNLLAYAAANAGIDHFVHGRARDARWWWALALGGVALQAALLAAAASPHWRAVAYNLTVAALLAGPILRLASPLKREFGGWGLLPLLPGAAMCLLAVARSAMLVADPSSFRPPASLHQNMPLLLATLLAAGMFNISFIGLVLGRLVMQLHRRLDTDPLTQLANRRGLQRELDVAWAADQRYHTGLAIAFIDIDRFKQINDSGGHDAGDRVIGVVAEALRHNARLTDHVGRWGGDEFMVVMPHTGHDAAMQAMQRLRERVQALAVKMPHGCPPLSLSIGVAVRRDDDAGPKDLIARADRQMYREKGSRPVDQSAQDARTVPI